MSVLGLYIEEHDSNHELDWRMFIFKDQYGEFDLYGNRMTTTPKRHRNTENYRDNDVYLHFTDRCSLLQYLYLALETDGGVMSTTFSIYNNLTENDYSFHEILAKHREGEPQNELFGYDGDAITQSRLRKIVRILDNSETW